jgi:hypothetical protein
MKSARSLAIGFGLVVLLACAGRPYDADTLQARFPTLDADGARVLARARPYLLPVQARVIWFVCRVDTETPVGIWLPDDAREPERQALEAALAAIEGSALGVRFARVPRNEAQIVIELLEGPARFPGGVHTANTVADCALSGDPTAWLDARVLSATLAFASVQIGRLGSLDSHDEGDDLDVAKLTGVVLHELGHALGFQGHVRSGGTVMVRDLEVLTRAGRAALDGEPLRDAALEALFALPSGGVLATRPVAPARTQTLDRLADLAETHGLTGPSARVGDQMARIFWQDDGGRRYGVQVQRLDEVLRDPTRIVLLPEPSTRAALSEGLDPATE